MNVEPDDDHDDGLTQITGHEVGVSAVTQNGAVVTIELLHASPDPDQ